MTAQTCPPEYLALAHALADAAGDVARRYFRQPVAVDDKQDDSPVTIADRETEAAMRKILAAKAPDHGIFGEEHGTQNLDAEWVWTLDPIDGTKAFVTGKPTFGTLISLLHRGRPVLGIIDQPISRERWLGMAGQQSTLNGQPIKTRPCLSLAQAACYTTAPELFEKFGGAAEWARLAAAVKLRNYGADCYAYGLLALGFVDVILESGLKPYDFFALAPVIEGAGGVISDWQGQPLGLHSDGRILAAGDAQLHAQALELLQSAA